VHIKGNCLKNISDKKRISELIKFWSTINLIDNSFLHGFLNLNSHWLSSAKKSNITVMISYSELMSIDNLINFSSLLKHGYKCILVTDTSNSYNLYEIIKLIESIDIEEKNNFDKRNILNCVTKNASSLFQSFITSGVIKKGNKASFNIFDYTSNQLLKNKNKSPQLRNLDKQSLTHVWSAGEQYEI
jgi:cytosine/adenosine deaminase-related metal-dependent hydrolase